MNNNTTWEITHNSAPIGRSAATEKEGWNILGAKSDTDRMMLKEAGFNVVKGESQSS